jgi:hypothetical protein
MTFSRNAVKTAEAGMKLAHVFLQRLATCGELDRGYKQEAPTDVIISRCMTSVLRFSVSL